MGSRLPTSRAILPGACHTAPALGCKVLSPFCPFLLYPKSPARVPSLSQNPVSIPGGGWRRNESHLKGDGEAGRKENTPEPGRRPCGHSHSYSRHVSLLSSAAQLRNISAAQSAIFESLQLLLGTGSAFCLAFSSERPVEGEGKKGRK